MPHCIIEYSDNLEAEGRFDDLMQKIAVHFRSESAAFPEAGVRIRTLPVHQYLIADGNPDHAFVNVTCRIGAGRPLELRKAFFGKAYEIVVAHFAEVSARRGLGITFYVDQADPDGSWKTNSIRKFMPAALR
ncbi:MAG TPA: hypothetical protein VGC31_06960 [Paenirhodobacter sp.]